MHRTKPTKYKGQVRLLNFNYHSILPDPSISAPTGVRKLTAISPVAVSATGPGKFDVSKKGNMVKVGSTGWKQVCCQVKEEKMFLFESESHFTPSHTLELKNYTVTRDIEFKNDFAIQLIGSSDKDKFTLVCKNKASYAEWIAVIRANGCKDP